MHFLASLHILLTCSFVVLLAYLLSRVFTYLAHSVIHGSDSSSRKTEGSSRSRRIQSFQTQNEKDNEDSALMARLQEEDEDKDEDEDEDAARTSKYDIGGSIFDDGIDQEYDVKRDIDVKQGSWDNEEGMKEEGLDAATGKERYEAGRDTTEIEYKDNENEGMKKGGAGLLEGKEENGSSSSSSREIMLGDTQGSSSPQQRLPPTWSDLERMVNLSSKKHSVPPSVSPLPE